MNNAIIIIIRNCIFKLKVKKKKQLKNVVIYFGGSQRNENNYILKDNLKMRNMYIKIDSFFNYY